jgi:hypothetical protein
MTEWELCERQSTLVPHPVYMGKGVVQLPENPSRRRKLGGVDNIKI